MLLLRTRDQSTGLNPHSILVFGLGLVGSSVVEAIRRTHAADALDIPFDWHYRQTRLAQTEILLAKLRENCRPESSKRLDIVWTAGVGGFLSSEEQLQVEMAAYEDVLEVTKTVQRQNRDALVVFHLVSSAGGLFEGQRCVTSQNCPAPRRPYGKMKEQQEQMLLAASCIRYRYIYRLSSVYGYFPGKREGLIVKLLQNCLNHRVTNIFGNLHTLRDYVYCDDIGRYIGRKIFSAPQENVAPLFLASGKSSSMREIMQIVGQVTQKRSYLQLDTSPVNAEDMGFLQSCLPADWFPTSLLAGVTITYRRIFEK